MCFFAAKLKGAILCACDILWAVGRPSLGAKLGIPDDFPTNCFPITPPGNGNIGSGYRDLFESGFKVGENSSMPKKIACEILTKKKNNFLEHDYFPLLKLKMWFFVQECAAKLPLFIFSKNNFSKILFFFTDIVADMAVRYTLCARYNLCAHCTSFF